MTDKRVVRHRMALRDSGGHALYVHLSPAATRALMRLRATGLTSREAVELAILAASPPPLEEDTAGWLDMATRSAQ